MAGRQRILPVRRDYNRFVADETLEDYALRFTARKARRWSPQWVSQTAIGAISFLALEAIGGAITLMFGFANAVAAILVVGIVLFATALPISRYASRYGVDIDLLTRGASFGYIGSTVTSLIYASFTFILFAIEAAIMTAALNIAFAVPLWLGYVVSAFVIIPLVTHGVTRISRFQLATQPLWIGLNLLPIGFILWAEPQAVSQWTAFPGLENPNGGGFDLLKFGAAASVILALMPQIGEQVDILRFLPAQERQSRSWRFAMLAAGPGWIVLGAPKLLLGSFLAVLALGSGVPPESAADPAHMYDVAFRYVFDSPTLAALVMALFVVVSQLKINVMNAYAGSLAWSNFFSRLTHSHPGRVVWLVFNVMIALLLMELGIYGALEATFGLFANVAVAWLGAIVADLSINKRLGLSPEGIEFKRAHLYDVNPVGIGAMGAATIVSLAAFAGWLGEIAQALSPFLALIVALVVSPLIAWATGGRYYLARKPRAAWAARREIECVICEHAFEPEDMAHCPAYAAPICSLCCSLDARCGDLCKPHAKFSAQAVAVAETLLPEPVARKLRSGVASFAGIFATMAGAIGLVLLLIHYRTLVVEPEASGPVASALLASFFILAIVAGIAAWFFVLQRQSRRVAQEESARQTTMLLDEIASHRRTDAALQEAKEKAEAASDAKSRYVVGMAHELRTPLNTVLGYAQLLERDEAVPEGKRGSLRVIRSSAEHLSGLIDGLLDVSKIEAGRLQLRPGAVRLPDFLDALADMFAMQADAKGLAFTVARAPNLPALVRTDEKRLRQILINILSNAIKYTEAGSVTLDVAYRSQVATFTVTDTGPGIAAGELSRIFDPFERGTAALGKAPGLGLGLTITRLLANLMGGDVTAESTVGQGSRFTVRVLLSAISDAKGTVPAPAPEPTGYLGARRTILVVDDEEAHRELMVEILRPLGFVVLTAGDGPAALELVRDIRPDLFLLDIQMPGLDGWTLARRLRERGQTGAIVMLSATLAETPDQAPGEMAPAEETLAKPFDIRQLLSRVAVLTGLEWTSENAPSPPQPSPLPVSARLAPADATELLELARIGYKRGIERKLEALERNPELRPLTDRLRHHAGNFDMKAFIALLETSGSE